MTSCADPTCADGPEHCLFADLVPLDGEGFWGTPLPWDGRVVGGKVDIAGFPNPEDIKLVRDAKDLLHDRAAGWSTTAGLFFPWTGGQAHPDLYKATKVGQKGGVAHVYQGVIPEVAGLFGAPGVVAAVPVQGRPLPPNTTFNVYSTYTFTTWDPLQPLRNVVKAIKALPLPKPTTAVQHIQTYEDFCVYQTRYDMPVFQQGKPPYAGSGGGIDTDAPKVQRHAAARMFITVPRRAAPSGGWPIAVFVRTGGGGDRPLIDRGVRDKDGVVAIPGSGPGLHFARAGFVGVQLDGPLGGIRNPTGGDEQLLIFNISNLRAMVGNLLQSAAELTVLPQMLAALSIPRAQCPGLGGAGADNVPLNPGRLALMGHSMGATIAPLTIAFSPEYGALLLSGAGGSWLENILHKRKPLHVKPIAEGLLGYTKEGLTLRREDPVLSLVQWAGEVADPPVFAAAVTQGWIARKPPHVLMLQGIVDRYIMPPIANATSMAYELDLAGPSLDVDHPETRAMQSCASALAEVGGKTVAYPVAGNRDDGKRTAVVVQHAEDGIEDGHEVVFQLSHPKAQYECFLKGYAAGTLPTVIGAGQSCPTQ